MTEDWAEQFWLYVDDSHVWSCTGPYALSNALTEAEDQMNMSGNYPLKVTIEKRKWP